MKTIYLIIILALLYACEKSEDVKPTQPKRAYEVTYFVESKATILEYTIEERNFCHKASNWDTTFTTYGGWTITFMTYGSLHSAGLVINGDTVDGCIGGNYCAINWWLKINH